MRRSVSNGLVTKLKGAIMLNRHGAVALFIGMAVTMQLQAQSTVDVLLMKLNSGDESRISEAVEGECNRDVASFGSADDWGMRGVAGFCLSGGGD
jgi:hypothetical protein